MFYIVTPSFNQATWLKGCLASVGAQTRSLSASDPAIRVHHHVQDGNSTDNTHTVLAEWEIMSAKIPGYTFSHASESDNGMYDAINKGWAKAPQEADVLTHLNCDEQYLPNSLANIADCFRKHKDVHVVLADMIVVDQDGSYICHRRSIRPYRFTSRFCCECATATTFQRVSVFRELGIRFDTRWKNVGDKVWYNALLHAGIRFYIYNTMTSIFFVTGNNKNWTEEGRNERVAYKEMHGFKSFDRWVAKFNAARRFMRNMILRPPLQYTIYFGYTPHTKNINKPTGLWHKRI